MTRYARRLLWVDSLETQRVNFLVYPFLWVAFFYGLGFTAFSWWSGVQASSLWLAFDDVATYMPHIWGVTCLLAGLCASILLVFRISRFGEAAAMFGFLVWLFAAFVYAENHFWLPFFTVTLPNIYFWTFYYFRVKQYERRKKSGLLIDAG